MLGSILAGILLAGLADAATSSTDAAGRAGGVVGLVGAFLRRLVDPSLPAIPDRARRTGSATSNPAAHLTVPPRGATAPVRDYGPAGGLFSPSMPGDPIDPRTGLVTVPQA